MQNDKTPSVPDSSTTPPSEQVPKSVASDEAAKLAALNEIVRRKRAEQGLPADGGATKPKPLVAPMPEPTPQEIAIAERRAEARRRWEDEQEFKRRQDITFAGRARYRNSDLENFECPTAAHREAANAILHYCMGIIDHIKAGDGIMLYGPPGTGKDHLLAYLMNGALSAGFSVMWKNGMDLFGEMRDRISDDQSERPFVDRMIDAQVLALSDPLPPFGDLSQFQAATLFRVIDGRYAMRRPTWVTLNVADRKEAGVRIGPQIVDRLLDGAVTVFCNWPSYRKPA